MLKYIGKYINVYVLSVYMLICCVLLLTSNDNKDMYSMTLENLQITEEDCSCQMVPHRWYVLVDNHFTVLFGISTHSDI